MIILIFSLLAGFSNSPSASEKEKILIYKGPGACDGCPESIGKILKEKGFDIRYVKPGELTVENFLQAALYVQPGGNDRILDTLEALSTAEKDRLKHYVREGGHYLGICAGGYLAGSKTDDDNGLMVKAFDLLPTIVDQESKSSAPKIESILWQNKSYDVYYQAGPWFDERNIPEAEIYSKYKKTGHSMAIIAPSGKGFVGLIGAHLEADKDWFREDHLKVPKTLTQNLLVGFIDDLLKRGMLKKALETFKEGTFTKEIGAARKDCDQVLKK